MNNNYSFPDSLIRNITTHQGHLLDDETYWDDVLARGEYDEDEEIEEDEDLGIAPDEAEMR